MFFVVSLRRNIILMQSTVNSFAFVKNTECLKFKNADIEIKIVKSVVNQKRFYPDVFLKFLPSKTSRISSRLDRTHSTNPRTSEGGP